MGCLLHVINREGNCDDSFNLIHKRKTNIVRPFYLILFLIFMSQMYVRILPNSRYFTGLDVTNHLAWITVAIPWVSSLGFSSFYSLSSALLPISESSQIVPRAPLQRHPHSESYQPAPGDLENSEIFKNANLLQISDACFNLAQE
jgi:hypothetical protein